MSINLKNIVSLREALSNFSKETFGFKGDIFINDNNLQSFLNVKSIIRECFYRDSNESVEFDEIDFNKTLSVSVDLGDVPNYYETKIDFLQSNLFECKYSEFYIHELKYFEGESSKSDFIENYRANIQIIHFLQEISDYSKPNSGSLEVFFYMADSGIDFTIDYSDTHLVNLVNHKPVIIDLGQQFSSLPDSGERKQIFINELIGLLKQKGTTYSVLLENLSELFENYKKSFALYLSGFSFDKIKTASIEYFHELTDRIHSTLLKFSAYIFGIPAAYILLVRFLDFNGENFLKDTFLIGLGVLFFLLIWFVSFKSISDALSAIEKDISTFKEKLGTDENLHNIRNELDNQSNNIIPKQRRRLFFVKVITIAILLSFISAYLIIHSDRLRNNNEKSINKNTVNTLSSPNKASNELNLLDSVVIDSNRIESQ